MSDKKSDDDNRPAGNQNVSPPPRGRMLMPPEIEENLKRVYQASLTEAVPDRFAKLLAQLREKEGKQ
jgi:Anti-sigma factor NepR